MAFDYMAAGPLLLTLFITATELLKWPRWVHYLWAAVALFWGIILLF